MKRTLMIATLACSVLLAGAMNSSEARPPVWKQAHRNYHNIERNYRQNINRLDRSYRNDFNRYYRGYDRYHRRYNNDCDRGNGAGFYAPGFGFNYGW